MISEERLKELIKEEKTVYIPDDLWGSISSLNLKEDFTIKDGRVHGSWNYLELEGASCLCSVPFKDLYETEGDAHFALEFGNIQKIEKLSLPAWEKWDGNFWFDAKGYQYGLIKCINTSTELNFGKECIYIWDCLGEHKNIGLNTKENYIKACRICKDLFLNGESDG